MGRREEPLDPDSPLFEFAARLRALRAAAGSPTYRQLATRAHLSPSVLSAAASGRSLPTLPVLLAYVQACGGDPAGWRPTWERLYAQLSATAPGLLDTDPATPAGATDAAAPHDPAPAAPAAAAPGDDPPAAAPSPGPGGAVPAGDDPAGQPEVVFEPVGQHTPGRVGTFRLAARLGGGAMGEVFLASSPAGRPVAIKVIRAEYARDPVFRARFAKEIAAVRTVTGAHTPAFIAADAQAEQPWIATAYVPGPSLDQVIQRDGPLPEPVVLALAAGIAEALAVIHATGIVHRDLKPSNILLDRDGPKVIDFGICRALDGTALTTTGIRVGTAGYTAPELAARGETLPAGDVFALGAVLAYAATGVTPFGDGPDTQVLYRIVHEPPAPAALACKDNNLRALIEACLAKDPAQRPTPQAIIQACGGTPTPHAQATPGAEAAWLPSALAAQAAAHSHAAAAQLSRLARRRVKHRVTIGLAPLILVLAIVTVGAINTAGRQDLRTDPPNLPPAVSTSPILSGPAPSRPEDSSPPPSLQTTPPSAGSLASTRPTTVRTTGPTPAYQLVYGDRALGTKDYNSSIELTTGQIVGDTGRWILGTNSGGDGKGAFELQDATDAVIVGRQQPTAAQCATAVTQQPLHDLLHFVQTPAGTWFCLRWQLTGDIATVQTLDLDTGEYGVEVTVNYYHPPA